MPRVLAGTRQHGVALPALRRLAFVLVTVALASVAMGLVAPSPATAREVCAIQPDRVTRSIDVFDGPVEDMATLVPDRGNRKSGEWALGYVYQAGRFVVVRCKYADGSTRDVKLEQRVERCSWKADARDRVAVDCR